MSIFKLFFIGVLLVFLVSCITISIGSQGASDDIVFGGKVVNRETGEWPNDRLVLLFLKSSEIARAVTAMGEFPGMVATEEVSPALPNGVVDGLFLLRAPNTYKITGEMLAEADPPLQFFHGNFPVEEKYSGASYTWFETIEEGSKTEIYIPAKNFRYTILVLNGSYSDLPAEMKRPNSLELLKDGQLAVKMPGTDETVRPEDLAKVAVDEVVYGQNKEELEVNKFTIPINNCGGNIEIRQKYIDSQTFIHEYTTELGVGIGVEIPVSVWAKLVAEAQTKYSFVNGQIDTRIIEYDMAAAPGTRVTYFVTWKEVWESGNASISDSGSSINVPFRVKTNVIYEVSSEAGTCQ